MRNLRHCIAIIGVLWFGQPARGVEAGAAGSAKIQAYELYEQEQYEGAAAQFKQYLEQNPDDLVAALDYVTTETARRSRARPRRRPPQKTEP